MNVMVVDVGGTHVKMLATGQEIPRKFASGPTLTAKQMVARVRKFTEDWNYEVVSIGYPGPVLRGRVVSEPHNLAPGWVGFDFEAAFGCPVKLINDAAMQALGSYEESCRMDNEHHVVILGGGFGGLYAAQSLRRVPVRVTLIDRHNFHLFQPLLYQVATGGLSPANIAAPLRSILRKQKNVRVFLAEACDVDLPHRSVILSDGQIEYDTLIVATGSTHSYFGHDPWAEFAPGLKTIEDATEIRRRVLLAFEVAERETRPEIVREWLNFVIVGGGPTGVELAGALAEIARNTLQDQFTSINPADAKIFLVEGGTRVLPAYPPELSEKASQFLGQLGVTVRIGATVTDIQADAVTIRTAMGDEAVRTRTVLWTAGVKASPMGRRLTAAAEIETDRSGRVPVESDLTLPGHPEVFVIGDLANLSHRAGQPLPGIAPVAMQEAKYVAKVIAARLRGQALPPFGYRDRGTMATVGRNRAIAVIGKLHLAGYFAWLIWLFVHLMYIVEFANRVLVLIQWAWNYLTWNRPARLITGESPLPIKSCETGPPQDGQRVQDSGVSAQQM